MTDFRPSRVYLGNGLWGYSANSLVGGPTCWVKDCTADATYTQEHKRADGTTEVLNFCHAHYFVVPKDMVLDQ